MGKEKSAVGIRVLGGLAGGGGLTCEFWVVFEGFILGKSNGKGFDAKGAKGATFRHVMNRTMGWGCLQPAETVTQRCCGMGGLLGFWG